MRVAALHVYPVKSAAGIELARATVERRGLAGDRRWMVVDEHGRFVTGRQLGRLAVLRASATAGGLRLELGGDRLEVALPTAARAPRSVQVWRDTVPARDAGDTASSWLSARFGRTLRLVYQHDDDRRPLGDNERAAPGDHVSFADAYPLLLIGSASLAALNDRLASPITMSRFRPNVVVQTDEPFVEDGWAQVRLGELDFAAVTRCSRCVFTTVDPATGERDPHGEPLRTLRTFRSAPASRKIMFGINLIPLARGDIAVGGAVVPGGTIARHD